MNIVAELHSHTNVSGHAFNTLTEMCDAAESKGLKALAITNHTATTNDTLTQIHFHCFVYLPRKIGNLYLLSGCEANIVDFDGNVDLDAKDLDILDFRIASKHAPCDMTFDSRWGNCSENTEMYLGVLKNPRIDCIGHCGNSVVPFDHETVVREAAIRGKVIEMNVSYPKRSPESLVCYRDIMRLCKKYDVLTAVTTDAHSIYALGTCELGTKLLDELAYPEELVINSSMDRLRHYFREQKGRDIFNDEMCF